MTEAISSSGVALYVNSLLDWKSPKTKKQSH